MTKSPFLFTPVLLLSLIACDGDGDNKDDNPPVDPPADTASLRVAHFSPDAPAVDIFVNAGESPAFAGAAFGDGTAYATLDVGDYDVQISVAGTTAADAVVTIPGISVMKDTSYTAIAHGYLAAPTDSDASFEVTIVEDDRDDIAEGLFRVQVIHAAALGAFATVDVWSVDDPDAPVALIPEFPYSAAVTTELPAGAYTVCLDVNADAACDATFSLPELSGGFINLIATNDAGGAPFLVALLEDGTTVRIDPNP